MRGRSARRGRQAPFGLQIPVTALSVTDPSLPRPRAAPQAELSLLGKMRQHAFDVAPVPGSDPSLSKDHHRFVSHLHKMAF
jgi:hypothetical protein